MSRINNEQAIAYDEVRWKVSYGVPTHGLESGSMRAAERDKLERDMGKRRSLRFSWRKKGRERVSSEGQEGDLCVAGSAKNARLDPHWLRDAGASGTESSPVATTRRSTYAYQH